MFFLCHLKIRCKAKVFGGEKKVWPGQRGSLPSGDWQLYKHIVEIQWEIVPNCCRVKDAY